jgi:hypothetical protein
MIENHVSDIMVNLVLGRISAASHQLELKLVPGYFSISCIGMAS